MMPGHTKDGEAMATPRIGVMGGTGLLELATIPGAKEAGWEVERLDDVIQASPFGQVPLRCLTLHRKGSNAEVFFLQRHHAQGDSTRPPHRINHHANVQAFVDAKVDAIVAVCSVGTLTERLPPGRVGVAKDALDMTGVSTTFHEEDAVFTSMSTPFDPALCDRAETRLREVQGLDASTSLGVTYWLTQGPQFETPAEVDAIERLGGEVVGMTMPREAKLAAERGMPYLALCIAANWAAGRSPEGRHAALDHETVSAEAHRRLAPVWAVLLELLEG